MCVIICLAFGVVGREEEEEAALLHLAVRSRSVIFWVLLTCLCVRVCWVSFSSLFLFEDHCCLDYADREREREWGRREREWEKREGVRERVKRVGQQPSKRKAINKQTHRLADWNTGIGIPVFPAPHTTGCSSSVNTLQLRLREASIDFELPFLYS